MRVGPDAAPPGEALGALFDEHADAIGEASAWKHRLDQVITDDMIEEESIPIGVPYNRVAV